MPVLRRSGIEFYSLQKGDRSQERRPATGCAGAGLGPLSARLRGLCAVPRQLDLVLTVDTSVAHMAGALGKPVWVLLSHVPDWRWGSGGEDGRGTRRCGCFGRTAGKTGQESWAGSRRRCSGAGGEWRMERYTAPLAQTFPLLKTSEGGDLVGVKRRQCLRRAVSLAQAV